MCGIVGSINTAITEETLSYIAHRGPDAQALVSVAMGANEVFLGHTRLSILDLSEAGSQPMFNANQDFAIIFNGEVYNHLELRARITGVSFRGHSDTETILHYLAQFGIEGVKDFNGIFSLALLDKRKGKVYLVRDHFGVKPLYYWTEGNKAIFSSELKTILYHPAYQKHKSLNINALDTFLTFRYNPAPQTMFAGINKLPAAHYLEIDIATGKQTFNNYWQTTGKTLQISEREAIEQYQFLVDRAVKRQMLSDVPIGLFLSGGIDSAVLAHLMQKHAPYQVKTFTVGFEDKGQFNETSEARKTAEVLGTNHHEILISQKDYIDFLNKSYYFTEEPIAEPTIPALYHVSNLASKHVKVVMSGQGADEPWAGYKRYLGEKVLSDFGSIIELLPWNIIQQVCPRSEAVSRLTYAMGAKNELERFLRVFSIFTANQKQNIFKQEYQQTIKEDHGEIISKLYDQVAHRKDSLSKMLHIDIRTMLPDNLLLFNDKITMSKSIENRVPYLDIDVVNFVESLPTNYKIKHYQQKYLHKKAVSEWLPQQILNRKKKGFLTPVDSWLQGNLNTVMQDIILSPNSACNQYFEADYLKNLFQEHQKRKANYNRHLFSLVSFELWHKSFFQ
jgi:asparagine synthase (glutamine-hydrolysing)